ncbi:hypothetical protein CROQUDRAFT_23070, partial [Cronartium quercuum f. sp. fusiforme G11]
IGQSFIEKLSIPLVSPHLVYIPGTDVGVTVNWFSQSKKWCEMLPLEMCVPMVETKGMHYYIYVPAQMWDGTVVVPVHFYSHNKILRVKC